MCYNVKKGGIDMKILSIGNSFSQDATRYLSQIAKANGDNIEVVSLYIGGCSLERHFRNMKSDAEVYEIIYCGQNTGFFTSIKKALLSRQWDVVTLQQQSLQSADFETFIPYIEQIHAFIKEYSPKSKIYMHETWAYENDSKKIQSTKYNSHLEMYLDIKFSCKKAANLINADGIIPCGALMSDLHCNHKLTVQRDSFHLSYGLGRFAAGLMWYKILFKKDVTGITLQEYDAPISDQELEAVYKAIAKIDY